MALKYKRHKETLFKFKGRDLFRERVKRGISRESFAERMGDTWYPLKVQRMEEMYINHVDQETLNAIQEALQK